ncbi:hypothetical protein [Thermoactinospora rubra]|uniref:hypothetical protein n=1 Tax=Thermoactinospora rubra TaxID=1088767 RepID=UPI00197D2B04|nr:hypothetical protein [Thermoactinospora rubra]
MSAIARIAELRRGRALHTSGRLFTGELEVLHHPPLGVPVLDSGRHRVLVRLSKGASLPGRLPDVLGLAVKIPGGGAGGRDLDLLLSSLPGRDFARRRYSTILRPRLTAEPLLTGTEPTGTGSAGPARPADPAAVHPPLAFAIKAGRTRIALLRVLEPAEGEADFDPTVNYHPAIRPRGLIQRLRKAAYAASRRGRRKAAGAPGAAGAEARSGARAGGEPGRLPHATVLDRARLALELLLPTLLQGVVLRRRLGVRLAALIDADGRATRLLRALRAKHGDGPLLVRVPLRGWFVLPLTDRDVRRVLEDPGFHPATRDKRAALACFQPDGVLITRDPDLRARRRRFNEAVLDTGRPEHRLAGRFRAVIEEEVAALPREGRLTWDDFSPVHQRIVRRIVLGDGARADEELTWLLNRLRGDANWVHLRGRRTDVQARFQRKLEGHLSRAEPGSLAALVHETPADPGVHREGQVPHWLFAFDAVGAAAFRALALLAAHPGAPIRDTLLESVRLWPTTLAILRDSPKGATVAVHSPYANRQAADGFRPGLTAGVPFSAGHARCPGMELAMLAGTCLLETLLRERRVALVHPRRLPDPPPGTLDHFALRFAVRPAGR